MKRAYANTSRTVRHFTQFIEFACFVCDRVLLASRERNYAAYCSRCQQWRRQPEGTSNAKAAYSSAK